jgi:hypothetical protein
MRLPRVRFTLRRMMVAVAVLAAAFAAWMEVAHYQWREHLNTEMTWGRSPAGQFFVKYDLKQFTANSLLKVSELGGPDREGYYTQHRWHLGAGGELFEERYGHKAMGWGGAGGQHDLTTAELGQVQQIISKLPPSDGTLSHGDLLLVASLSEGSWVTRVYNKAALPPTVQDLVRILRLALQ